MGNEGQQAPLPQQGQPADYYSWQYDQEHPAIADPQSPEVLHAPQQPIRVNGVYPSARYQEPIADMGTSLGYNQGSEYQYFNAPQPSQPMAQLRQERLQQLREDRMRRQQRRMGPDVTIAIPRKGKHSEQPVSESLQNERVWGPDGQPMIYGNHPSANPPVQASPVLSFSVPNEASPANAAAFPAPYTSSSVENSVSENLQPAVALAQDTGMLQRVNIRRASLILTGAFVASRILGLMRTSMFAFVFGTGPTSDAYLQAFLIPDTIFNIVAGGALSSAFIPVFAKYMIGEHDEKAAWRIASSALNLAIVIMSVLALIAIIFARQLVPLYNPGPSIHDKHYAEYLVHLDLIATLTRIMLLQSIVLGGGVIVNAVLNARQNFLLPAVGTVLYNVGLIAGLIPGIYFAFHGQRNDSTAVLFATWGVVIGALLQVAVQVPGLFKVGMHYTPSFDWRHPGVLQIGRQMIPRIINAAMLSLSTFVDRGLILLLVVVVGTTGINGLVTQYYQSLQLVLLPLGVFGMAVSTAAFPTLAENVAKGRFDRVRSTVLETLRSILFMSIPASIGLIVLGLPIIQVLLEHGRFSLADAQSTVIPLAFFSFGLTGLAAVEILTRSFYAMRDSITPVVVSVGQFVFKIALSLLLINVAVFGAKWGMGALAFSTSLAGLVEAVLLFWLLHQRVGGLQIRVTAFFAGRVILASLAMGLALLIVRNVLDLGFGVIAYVPALNFLDTTRTQSLGFLGTFVALFKLIIEMFVGVIVYIRVARLLGIEELGPIKRVLDRLKLSWI
ncbi:MAG: hypothetical protein PVS3B3_14550 [Ktedonobacteraceae bacterium]